jgi:hypothetical protein
LASPGFSDAGTEKNHSHHLAFHCPYVSPKGLGSGAETTGSESLANTGVDMISDRRVMTNAMLCGQYFTLTFTTVSSFFLVALLRSQYQLAIKERTLNLRRGSGK